MSEKVEMESELMDVEDSVESISVEAGCTEKPSSAVAALLKEEVKAATCSGEHEKVEEIVAQGTEIEQNIGHLIKEKKTEVEVESEVIAESKFPLEEPKAPKEPEAESKDKVEEQLKEQEIITEKEVAKPLENVDLIKQVVNAETEELNAENEVTKVYNVDSIRKVESVEPKDLNTEKEVTKQLENVELSKQVENLEAEEKEVNKDLENVEAKEDANDKSDVDDGNESQESIALVIDEKSNEHMEDDKKEDNMPKSATVETELDKEITKNTEGTKDDEKDSGKDTSEISAATQIDTAELVSEVVDKSTTNIIEIDDDAEDEGEEVVANAEDGVEEKADEEKQTVSAQQEEENNITVIEIDDEDDVEEMKEVPSPSTGIQETKNVDEKEVRLDDKTTTLEIVSDMDVDAEKPAVIESNTNDDIEMKEKLTDNADKTNAKPAKIKEETATLLQEITPRPASPKPTAEEQAQDDDTTDEVFYNKECINHECPHNHKQYFRVPQFAFSYYKVNKKKFKTQYICGECYDKALDVYEEYCGLLMAKQPLMLKQTGSTRLDIVEIIDSSDEEDAADKTEKEKAEKPCFSKADLELIEKELENSIKSVMNRTEIQNQMTWSKTILETRLKKLAEDTKFIGDELNALQKKADTMHEALYQCPKIKIRQLQPLDLNSGLPYAPANNELPQLPPIGEIQRPPIQINEIYYAVKNKAIASWVPCKVTEQVEGLMGAHKSITHYKIKFLKSQYQMLKSVSVKHLAYYNPPPVRLPIGVRVIAYFDATSLSRGKEKMLIQSAFYPGIIAEPLKPTNKYRYLIFYDDGYTQYVYHKDVRLVCNVSENVWEDVHPGSRDFIQKYLTQYSINRPMVQTQKGQSMTTESNGKWIYARVVDIDCSLIQMQFEGPKSHTEWIYRGSMRLGPVFKEYQKSLQKDTMPISRLPRRTEPFIRYTEDEEATNSQQTRAVAKKSVSRQDSTASLSSTSHNASAAAAAAAVAASAQQQTTAPIVRHLNNSTIYLEDESKPKGKVVYYTAKRNLPPLLYKQHYCSSTCLFKITHNLSAYSPLSKPLLSGWERIVLRQKIKKVVAYRAPCGKIFRNMKELRNYLRITENVLNVDNFDFCHETNCLAEYVIESAIVQRRDISNGLEKMALPLVNYYDNTMPPECKYAAQRIPTEGVNLNLDEEFLVGCDCDDDCSDKAKCSCWQLTYAGAKYGNPNTPMEEIGYQYKRLYEHVPTGIYECNSRCKCKSNCLNRVAQHSLEMKLQVFKTSNRGWGLRCINDVPRGSFICIYAGHLLTEAKANEGGLDAGDEYFAELDYIEVAEQIKEGYESDVEPPEPEEEEDLYAPEHDDDDEFTPSKSFITRSRNKARLMRSNQTQNAEDGDSQERQVINFNPNAEMNENSMRESSIRTLFGNDEACYIMDAKITGNLGRYFNHSCSPNLFVQNVFVDTHDLRFPWVAFFSSTHIRAGTELTWNYNYEVGVVPGKVLYCQCGAPNCRLRLL